METTAGLAAPVQRRRRTFSKLKRLLRAAAARTADALQAAIGAALAHLSPAECTAHLRRCGYARARR